MYCPLCSTSHVVDSGATGKAFLGEADNQCPGNPIEQKGLVEWICTKCKVYFYTVDLSKI